MIELTKKGFLSLSQLYIALKNIVIVWFQVLVVTLRGFMQHRIALQASALTFFSLLSVVPIAALAFGISKGFGFEHKLSSILADKLQGQQEVLNWVLSISNNMLERTRGGLIATVGMVVLFLSIFKVLDNMENSFNDIWQINKPRSIFRKFSDYVSIMLFAPVFIVISSSATVTITAKIDYIIQSIKLLGYLAPAIIIIVKVVPYVLISLLFTIIYMVMPNTVVKYKSGIIAGIIAGSAFQITQWAYIKFQIGVSAYNGIYGSFAALPLFMIWLQTGWIIVLLGAELAFVIQNYDKFEFDKNTKQLSNRGKNTVTLLVMHCIVKKFVKGEKAPDLSYISNYLKIHGRVAQEIVNTLMEAGLVSEVLTVGRKLNAFQPAIDVTQITVKLVIDRVENIGAMPLQNNIPEVIEINKLYNQFDNSIESSEANILLKDLV